MNICPQCKTENCVDDRIYRNTEFYGNGIFTVPCVHCRQMLCVHASRIVRITSIELSTKTTSDFVPNR